MKRELEASYARYGSGPEFWNTYQRVLNRLTTSGEPQPVLADQLALAIEQLGLIQRAMLVGDDARRS